MSVTPGIVEEMSISAPFGSQRLWINQLRIIRDYREYLSF